MIWATADHGEQSYEFVAWESHFCTQNTHTRSAVESLLAELSFKGISEIQEWPHTPHTSALAQCALFHIGHTSIFRTDVPTSLWERFRPKLSINAESPVTPVALYRTDLPCEAVLSYCHGGDVMNNFSTQPVLSYLHVTWLDFNSNVSCSNVFAVIRTGVRRAILPTVYCCSFYYIVEFKFTMFSTAMLHRLFSHGWIFLLIAWLID